MYLCSHESVTAKDDIHTRVSLRQKTQFANVSVHKKEKKHCKELDLFLWDKHLLRDTALQWHKQNMHHGVSLPQNLFMLGLPGT